jgi:hypothetical protein
MELIYVTAQPDVPYFHWQAKIYGHNFVSKGIKPENIHIIYGLCNGQQEPSEGALELRNYGYNVHFYKDERFKKHYIPSIKPFLISKWLEEYPELGKLFFLHDADIIFRELPDYSQYIDDEKTYLSDTKGYIGYEYIKTVADRHETQYKDLQPQQLIQEMCDVIGVELSCVKKYQESSGGGQYIIKGTDSDFWKKVCTDSIYLYDRLFDFQKRYPIEHGQIQYWTAEMWALLWNIWRDCKETKIIDELGFSWATSDIKTYNEYPILHMAGVQDSMRHEKFYKGEFINVNPIDRVREDENYFNYVDDNSATIEYVKIIKEFAKK